MYLLVGFGAAHRVATKGLYIELWGPGRPKILGATRENMGQNQFVFVGSVIVDLNVLATKEKNRPPM